MKNERLKDVKTQNGKVTRPLQEQFPKVETEQAMGVMIHKDGTVEKRKF